MITKVESWQGNRGRDGNGERSRCRFNLSTHVLRPLIMAITGKKATQSSLFEVGIDFRMLVYGSAGLLHQVGGFATDV